MTITAEFSIRSPALPLVGFAESLPSHQLEVEHGLCLASLGDIADELGLPKSTLRYRLRRAESWLTETVVADHGMLDVPLEPRTADD